MGFGMDGEVNFFRKKFIGGFNRQDVVEYVTKLAKERNEMSAERDKALQSLRALEAETAAVRTELDDLRKSIGDYKVKALLDAAERLSELEEGFNQLQLEVGKATADVRAELESAVTTVSGVPSIFKWAGEKINELKSTLDDEIGVKNTAYIE